MSNEKKKCGIGWFKNRDGKNYIMLMIDYKKYAMFENQLPDNKNKFDFILYESAPKDRRDKGKQGIGWKLNTPDKFAVIIKINDKQYFLTSNKLKSDNSNFDIIVYPYIGKKKRKEVNA